MHWKLAAFFLTAAAVLMGCLVPGRWVSRLPHDKLLHFLAYALLTALAWEITPQATAIAWWVLALTLAGWGIELLQTLVPGRRFCWRDGLANMAGIFTASLGLGLLGGLRTQLR